MASADVQHAGVGRQPGVLHEVQREGRNPLEPADGLLGVGRVDALPMLAAVQPLWSALNEPNAGGSISGHGTSRDDPRWVDCAPARDVRQSPRRKRPRVLPHLRRPQSRRDRRSRGAHRRVGRLAAVSRASSVTALSRRSRRRYSEAGHSSVPCRRRIVNRVRPYVRAPATRRPHRVRAPGLHDQHRRLQLSMVGISSLSRLSGDVS